MEIAMARKSKATGDNIGLEPVLITNPKIVRIGRGDGHSPPCLSYDGSAPNVGQEISFALENGVTYCGIVADAVEADGNVFVEFEDGIEPISQK
jgi:hypothetical protein